MSPASISSWDALWAPRMQLAQQHPTQHQFLLEARPGSSPPGLCHQSKDPELFFWTELNVKCLCLLLIEQGLSYYT